MIRLIGAVCSRFSNLLWHAHSSNKYNGRQTYIVYEIWAMELSEAIIIVILDFDKHVFPLYCSAVPLS